jgi:RNA polymerase sigma factor (sigma-70 family)
VLVRRYGGFEDCEDAVQEALIEAAKQWPTELPDSPKAWLVAVASRRLVDAVRSTTARRRREEEQFALETDTAALQHDDTLDLLFLCCHPALSEASQLALTLRAVGGLTTAEIASAFFVPESTMAQRISRAKQQLKTSRSEFGPPPAGERDARLRVVMHVLYLVFNEGYAASSGEDTLRPDLTTEAIRITRMLRTAAPASGEVAGLLALMLLTDARRPARLSASGDLVPLAEQDRGRWDSGQIGEGIGILTDALRRRAIGPYQVQAAIAAIHDEAPSDPETDWSRIVGLYDVLMRLDPSPVVSLNRVVALARVAGPRAALDELASVELPGHRVEAVRAHLLEECGEVAAAREAYRSAALLTGSELEARYLRSKADTVGSTPT